MQRNDQLFITFIKENSSHYSNGFCQVSPRFKGRLLAEEWIRMTVPEISADGSFLDEYLLF